MGESGKRKSKRKRSTSSLSIGAFALRRDEPEEGEERTLPPQPDDDPEDEPEKLPPPPPDSEIEEKTDEVSPPPPPPPLEKEIEEPVEVSPSPSPPPPPEPEDDSSLEEESSEDGSEEIIESPGEESEEIEAPEEAPEPPQEPAKPEEIPDSKPEDDSTEDESLQSDEAPKKPVVSKGETFNMCPICMGLIKHGLSMLVCNCHKVYHVSCGKRLGHCPNCEFEFSDDMVVGTEEEQKEIQVDYESHVVPKLQLTPEDKLELLEERLILGEVSEEVYRELKSKYERERELGEPEGDELYRCPSCGNMVDRDAERCSCGAVFSGEVGFLCPECGRVISFDAKACNNCGVRFSESGSFICPSCGRTLERGAAECQCGTRFSDALVEGFNCPECGSFLESDATECDNCGVSFEEED